MNKIRFATVVVTMLFTLMPFFAKAQSITSYLDVKAFGDCIALKINKNGGDTYFKQRVIEAKAFRIKALASSKYIQMSTAKLNFLNKQIFLAAAYASLPFINSSAPNMSELKKGFALDQSLFQLYNKSGEVKPVDRTDLAEIVNTANLSFRSIDARLYVTRADSYLASQQEAASLANPLVIWLVQQPNGSVSHWALLDYATRVYSGDILTALGVIGELFWQDALQSAPNRIENAVLSAKMKPLVSPNTHNPVGDNYHFWQIITAAYYEGGTTLGRIYSKFDSKDPGHILANSLGLDVADRTLQSIGNRAISCELH